MTTSTSLQDAVRCDSRVHEASSSHGGFGTLIFYDGDGSYASIFTTPERATRMAALWAEMDAEDKATEPRAVA